MRHLYQVGRAPENAEHPDHAFAKDLTRGFWASLPEMNARLLAALLARGRGVSDPAEIEKLAADMSTDKLRATLGRIACGYDGGQIFDD